VNAPVPHLPGDFYTSTPALLAVRQAAFARQVSPDAVLAVVLCRVAASLPPGIVLPEGGTLDFVAALIGAPGSGKSKAMRAATDLLPNIGTTYDGVNIGSGEGIASAYVGKVDDSGTNPLHNTSALFYVDEGEQLLTVGRREGSTTFSTIRSAWSGQSVGSLNASPDRRRIVKAGTYRFALAVGFQDTFAAELLNGQNAGDPQRYLFAGVTHPDIRDTCPPFPQPLHLPLTGSNVSDVVKVDSSIVDGLRRRRGAIGRGETRLHPLDTHRDLLTLKVAALISYLNGNGDVDPDAWTLANAVVENGRAVRQHLVERSQAAKNELLRESIERDAVRDAMREESKLKRAVTSSARSMIRRARKEGKPVTKSILSTSMSGQHRAQVEVDDVIDYACEVGTDDGRLKRQGDYFVHVPAA
jgi:hypothetical protein